MQCCYNMAIFPNTYNGPPISEIWGVFLRRFRSMWCLNHCGDARNIMFMGRALRRCLTNWGQLWLLLPRSLAMRVWRNLGTLYEGFTRIASSLVSRVFRDFTWRQRLEDWRSFHWALPTETSAQAGLQWWLVDQDWSVITPSITWLSPGPPSPEYSPIFTTFSPIKF